MRNPFYNNYLFTIRDLKRPKLRWWVYPQLFFKPMYAQVVNGHIFHYKYDSKGMVYLFNTEEIER